ncbi:MAG: hypothetical protein WDN03_15465 [Rhizomicrobium sp.]
MIRALKRWGSSTIYTSTSLISETGKEAKEFLILARAAVDEGQWQGDALRGIIREIEIA